MSNRIVTLNEILIRLDSFKHDFKNEAIIINYFKCVLLNEQEIDEFEVNGIYVMVYKNGNGYSLYYEDEKIDLIVQDKMIVDIEY